MQYLSRPRNAAERAAVRNYVLFGIASTLGMTVVVGGVSVYLITT